MIEGPGITQNLNKVFKLTKSKKEEKKVTCHALHIAYPMSNVMCDMSPVTCNLTPTAAATDPPPGNFTIMTGLQNQNKKPKCKNQLK